MTMYKSKPNTYNLLNSIIDWTSFSYDKPILETEQKEKADLTIGIGQQFDFDITRPENFIDILND